MLKHLALKHLALHVVGGAVLLVFSPSVTFAEGATFGKDIAPILNRSCVTCHRPGEAAPMSLIGYENVRPWLRSIAKKVVAREMPPWSADPSRSVKFQNDPTLSQAEIDVITRWIDAGAPKGADPIPAPPTVAEGWRDASGREPDYVLTLPGYAVPAVASKETARMLDPVFYVKVPFDADKWVRASQARPDQRAVVHYMDLNIVELPDGTAPGPDGLLPAAAAQTVREIDFLTANFRPGAGYESFPAGSARRLPGGSNRYFQITMHYQPNGTAMQDHSRFGFWFEATAPAAEIVKSPITAGLVTAEGKEVFNGASPKAGPTLRTKVYYPTIPANTSRFEVTSIQAVTTPITIYELTPHAHNRATDFKYTLVYPDGREQALLTVPKYDESWQYAYLLAQPVNVPAGSKIVVVAHYNNSLSNRTVTTPDQPGSDMFMPLMQSSAEAHH
jgi:hypothetical protein